MVEEYPRKFLKVVEGEREERRLIKSKEIEKLLEI